MLPGLLTPTHVLVIVAILAVTFGLRKVTTPVRGRPVRLARQGPGASGACVCGGRRGDRLTSHGCWSVRWSPSLFTRAVALPLFLLVFLALWICGYGVLSRLYR